MKEENGLILIELLTATAIFAIGVVVVFALFTGAIQGGLVSLERTNAHLVSLEMKEAARSLERSSSWLLTPGRYEVGINSDREWVLLPKNGLVGHFLLAENIDDKSGYDNVARKDYIGFSDDRKGKLYSAATFNGVSSIIRMRHDFSLDVTGPLTLSAWVMNMGTDSAVIAGRYDEETENGGYALYKEGSNYVFKVFKDGGGSESVTTPAGSGWEHLVGVFEPGENLHIFVDGEKKNSTAIDFTSLNEGPGIDFTIGTDASEGDNKNVWNGRIGDIRVYNRSLVSQQIAGLYGNYDVKRSMSLKVSNTDSLLASWSFNEGEGCVVHDNSENYKHGHLKNCQNLWGNNRLNENAAFDFDGLTFLEIPQDNIFNLNEGISISLWVKPPYPLPEETKTLLHKRADGSENYSFILIFDEEERAYEWGVSTGTGDLDSVKAKDSVAAGTWQHLLLTFDGIERKIYINNNVIEDVTSSSLSNPGSDADIFIGQNAGGDNGFTGMIDDVRLYGETLSEKERLKIFLGDVNFFLE